MKLENIEKERQRLGMTVGQAVHALGTSRRAYKNAINGIRCRVSLLVKMALLFDCSVDYLVGRTNDRRGINKGGVSWKGQKVR